MAYSNVVKNHAIELRDQGLSVTEIADRLSEQFRDIDRWPGEKTISTWLKASGNSPVHDVAPKPGDHSLLNPRSGWPEDDEKAELLWELLKHPIEGGAGGIDSLTAEWALKIQSRFRGKWKGSYVHWALAMVYARANEQLNLPQYAGSQRGVDPIFRLLDLLLSRRAWESSEAGMEALEIAAKLGLSDGTHFDVEFNYARRVACQGGGRRVRSA